MMVRTGYVPGAPADFDRAALNRRFGKQPPPRPGFDHAGIDIATGPRPVIGERDYAPSLPTARDHGDDDLATDRPMSAAAWLVLLVAVAVAVVSAALLVKL